MGYNTKKFDQGAHYASKSMNELVFLLKEAEVITKQYPSTKDGFINEYIQTLKLKISERINKKKL